MVVDNSIYTFQHILLFSFTTILLFFPKPLSNGMNNEHPIASSHEKVTMTDHKALTTSCNVSLLATETRKKICNILSEVIKTKLPKSDVARSS